MPSPSGSAVSTVMSWPAFQAANVVASLVVGDPPMAALGRQLGEFGPDESTD